MVRNLLVTKAPLLYFISVVKALSTARREQVNRDGPPNVEQLNVFCFNRDDLTWTRTLI